MRKGKTLKKDLSTIDRQEKRLITTCFAVGIIMLAALLRKMF
ncbi:hypothetical protein ACFP56_05510 [Paenibacillus septentrionalis]|uniref:DUF4044 domain-containing protein n=1 Tax=Paenibacillus septentrionalis TaxID=429342 RepID=A0ABW1V2S5_9BACL